MSIVFMLLPYVLVGTAGLGAGWLLTRAHARTVALQMVLNRVEVWMRYITAHIDKADLRQDRRAEYLVNRAVGLIDTVQIPALRLVGSGDDPASVSIPAQAKKDRMERDASVTPIGPHVDKMAADLDAVMEAYMRGLADKNEEPSGDITGDAT